MMGIDYIRPWVFSGGCRYGYRQRQVTGGVGEAGVAMSQMSNNKEASQELSLDYLINCPTAKYYTLIINWLTTHRT